MWEINATNVGSEVGHVGLYWLEQVPHLTHGVPPAALPGGCAPDGLSLLWCWPKTATLTGPVYTRSGCLYGVYVCVGA